MHCINWADSFRPFPFVYLFIYLFIYLFFPKPADMHAPSLSLLYLFFFYYPFRPSTAAFLPSTSSLCGAQNLTWRRRMHFLPESLSLSLSYSAVHCNAESLSVCLFAIRFLEKREKEGVADKIRKTPMQPTCHDAKYTVADDEAPENKPTNQPTNQPTTKTEVKCTNKLDKKKTRFIYLWYSY